MWPEKFSLRHNSEFFLHLEELRQRLLFSLCVFFAAFVVSFYFSHALLDFLIGPLRAFNQSQIYFQEPYEAFLIHIQIAALAAFVISSPVLLTQMWVFIAPGLYEKEKKLFVPVIAASIALFLFGTWFAYQFAIPWGLYFLLSFQTESLRPLLRIGPYFSFLIGMVLAFGVLFEFPVVIIGLVKLGIVNTRALAKSRRIIIVVLFIVAAILTPSPDPFSQVLLALPLFLLFEGSLWIARCMERR